MYYIRPLLYDSVTVILYELVTFFFTKCIGNLTNCIGAVMQSNPMDSNTHCIVTNTFRTETVAKS